MVRIFAPLKINYGLVSTSLIITTSAISTSIIAINYDLSSVLKQLLQPAIDKIQSAISYLGLDEGLKKLKNQVEKAFQSLKTLDFLQSIKTLFQKLKNWIDYLSEKLPQWLQWQEILTFLDWLYVVLKSIVDIFNEVEWKKVLGLIFTKEFWEFSESLGWIVSKTGGLKNWGGDDFKKILDPVIKSKDSKEIQENLKKLLERATDVLKDVEQKSKSSSSQSQLAQQAKKKLIKPQLIKELVTKFLKILVVGTSGREEENKNQNNIDTIAGGTDKIFWSFIYGLKNLVAGSTESSEV